MKNKEEQRKIKIYNKQQPKTTKNIEKQLKTVEKHRKTAKNIEKQLKITKNICRSDSLVIFFQTIYFYCSKPPFIISLNYPNSLQSFYRNLSNFLEQFHHILLIQRKYFLVPGFFHFSLYYFFNSTPF